MSPVAWIVGWALATPMAHADSEATTTLPKISVVATEPEGYAIKESRTSTKTDTQLRDVPQSISVISGALLKDQAIHGLADAMRYVPGAGMAQGEGNRDTVILRGNSSTADFF